MTNQFSELVPELLTTARELHSSLIPVAMVILLVALVAASWHGSIVGDTASMLRAVGSTAILAVVIQLFPDWADELTRVTHGLIGKMDVDPANVHRTFAHLITGVDESQDVGLWDVLFSDQGGIADGMIYAVAWMFGKLSWAVIWVVYLIQNVVIILSIGASPIMLAMFALNATRGVAIKFVLSLFGVMLWPLGWAVAHIVTEALLQMAADHSIYMLTEEDSLLSGTQTIPFILILSLWMLPSTIAAPFIISRTIQTGSQIGTALLSSVAAAAGQGLSHGVGSGVTAGLAGASSKTSVAAGVLAGTSGLASGAMGSSGVLVPTAIATMAVAASSRRSASAAPTDVNARAAEIAQKNR